MSKRKKGLKQAEVRTLPNVFDGMNENLEEQLISHFKNKNSVTLEIGCGNGEYTTALAKKYPQRNFVGIDVKGSRLWKGAKGSLAGSINNAAFIICRAERILTLFDKLKVEEIWIPFPNPFPLQRGIKQRLVHPRFIAIYKSVLTEGGKVHLKTDADSLFEYALKVAQEENLYLEKVTDDLHNNGTAQGDEKILTKYEMLHLNEGRKIKLVSFSINNHQELPGFLNL